MPLVEAIPPHVGTIPAMPLGGGNLGIGSRAAGCNRDTAVADSVGNTAVAGRGAVAARVGVRTAVAGRRGGTTVVGRHGDKAVAEARAALDRMFQRGRCSCSAYILRATAPSYTGQTHQGPPQEMHRGMHQVLGPMASTPLEQYGPCPWSRRSGLGKISAYLFLSPRPNGRGDNLLLTLTLHRLVGGLCTANKQSIIP